MEQTHMTGNTANPRHASSVNFHHGEALLRIASTYPTIFEVVMEQVQNAIDVNAKRIQIVLNRKTRNITVMDDGDGVSREDFEYALGSVCSSVKQQGKLGRYGIGLISPLGKCESFLFVSCPRGVAQGGGYMEWTFNTEEIRQQGDDVDIPCRPRSDYFYRASGKASKHNSSTPVTWRTLVAVRKYTADKLISRIANVDVLVEGILERYGAAMRKNRVAIWVRFVNEDGTEEARENIQAKLFTGKRLDEVVHSDKDAGETKFQLYLAQKTTKGRGGKVLMGEVDNDFRFGFDLFARTAVDFLSDEAIQTLKSGVFEGEILTARAKLHANRRSFERDDAFVGLCVAIDEWYQKHGKKHLDEVKEARDDQRYQELGLRSLKAIEALLRDPKFSFLNDVIRSFQTGNIGEGHFEPPRKDIAGVQKEPAATTHAGTSHPRTTDSSSPKSGGGGPTSTDKEKEGHHPYTVSGPKGQRRTLVKSGSFGLQFSHIAMEGQDRLWELDPSNGILHFNIRHPIWVACDESARQITQLQEFIAIQALTLHAMPDEWEETARLACEDMTSAFAFLIKNSASYKLARTKSVEE